MAKNSESTKAEHASEMTFEQALANLEAVIRDLEDGRLGLTESLGRYEEGVKLLKHCHEALGKAERKILLLTGVDADGNPVTEPFDDAAMTLEEKKESRVRRRSRAVSVSVTAISETNEPDLGASEDSNEVPGDEGSIDRQKGLF